MTNGKIPTENHGGHKKAFIDLKFETVLEIDEINAMLGSEFDRSPALHLFDADQDNRLRLPDVYMEASLREDIAGDLRLTIGNSSLDFDGAHTVGTVNKLTFMHGGKGRLGLQFRLTASPTALPKIVEAVEIGECMLRFTESDESAENPKADEKQEEMTV